MDKALPGFGLGALHLASQEHVREPPNLAPGRPGAALRHFTRRPPPGGRLVRVGPDIRPALTK